MPRPALALCGLLLLAGLAVDGPLAPSAWAASAPALFEGTGILELLPPTDLVGDGATPADLYFLALNPRGEPISGWKVTLKGTGGVVGELVELGGGLYRFPFTPAATEEATTATFELRGKLPTREAFAKEWTVPVAPPRNHGLKLEVSPGQMTLGVDKTANVAFTVTGGTAAARAMTKLLTATSAGTLSAQTNLGGGQFNALFTAPPAPKPQVALITVVDAGDASRTYGSLVVPMAAQLDQVVAAKPKSQVLLKVGGRDFGPVPTDGKGKAKLKIVVPPGVTTATQVVVGPDGVPVESTLDLKIAETRRLALFPTAVTLPADTRVPVSIRAVVVTPDGRPDEAASLELAASSGSIGSPRHEGGGVYVATWTPPLGNTAAKVTFTAKLAGASPIQTDTRVVDVVPVRPAGVSLAADPPTLPPGAPSLAVVAKVEGPDGAGLNGRTLAFTANGAKLQGVVDQKDGSYKATFTPTGKGPVEVMARAPAPALGNPLARVVVVPTRELLPPDGLSSAMLLVATLDDYGYPVPDQEVTLVVKQGDGALPATVRTNGEGVAQVYYTAGRKNGLVTITVTAMDRSAGVTLLQAPPELKLPDLPVGGTPAVVGLAKELEAGLAHVRVERGG